MRAISLILILVALLSCKNTKEIVKNETEVKTSTEKAVVKTDNSKAASSVVTKKTEAIAEDDNTYTVEEIKELSVPDATGKQYPTKVTKRVISTDKTKQGKTDVTESSAQAVDTKKTETENKVTDQTVASKTDSKIVKKSQSWKAFVVIFLILVAAGFVIYKFKGRAIKAFIVKIWKR